MYIASGAPVTQPGRTSHDLASRSPIAPHRFRHTAPVRGPPLVSSQLETAYPPSAGAVSTPVAGDVTNGQSAVYRGGRAGRRCFARNR
jgi:hypothetical protein